MTPPDFDAKLDAAALLLSPAVAFEAKAGPSGEIAGLASPFGAAPDAYGDRIAAGAFGETLAAHKARGTAPAMLWAHDPARPVGRWEALTETPRGLEVRGRVNLATAAGRDAYEHLRAGDVTGLSIGYAVAPGGAERDARGGRLLTKVNLAEVSLVALPAAPEARVREVKQLGSLADLRDLLREAGLARGAAEKVAAAGWPALAGFDPEADALAALAAEIKAAAAAFKRI